MTDRAASKRKGPSPRVASWVYDVINVFIDALETETAFLRGGDTTWRFYNSQLELIRPLQAYLSRDAQHILRDLSRARTEFANKIRPHDVMRSDLEAAAGAAASDLLSDAAFREMVAAARARYLLNHPGDVPTGAFPPEKHADLVAERLVNGQRDIGTRNTDFLFWKLHGAEFAAFTGRTSFESLRNARDALLVFDVQTIDWLSKYSFDLCEEFDIPAAPSAAGLPAVVGAPYERPLSAWAEDMRDRIVLWNSEFPDRGWFSIVIVPDLSFAESLDHRELKKLARDAQVQLQGLELPSFENSKFGNVENLDGAIRGTLDLSDYQELWHLHDTGLFMSARLLHYVENDKKERVLPFEQLVWLVSLSVLFAERLFSQISPNSRVDLQFALHSVKGHELGTFDPYMRAHNRITAARFVAAQAMISVEETVGVASLRKEWRRVAKDASTRILRLFNWDTPDAAVDNVLATISVGR